MEDFQKRERDREIDIFFKMPPLHPKKKCQVIGSLSPTHFHPYRLDCLVVFHVFLPKALHHLHPTRPLPLLEDFLRYFCFGPSLEAATASCSESGLGGALCAVLSGDAEMLRVLVEAKADVNEKLPETGATDGWPRGL